MRQSAVKIYFVRAMCLLLFISNLTVLILLLDHKKDVEAENVYLQTMKESAGNNRPMDSGLIEPKNEDRYRDLKYVALTFDDGPHPVYTDILLDGLKERGIRATFFVTGDNASLYPELILRMKAEGHQIGNHTLHHTQLTSGNTEAFLSEVQQTNRIIYEIIGEEPCFIRPPYGCYNSTVSARLDLFPILWDIDPLDWCSNNAACITSRVVSHTHNNTVILMHDSFESSVTAALSAVDELLRQGYCFVTVEELTIG